MFACRFLTAIWFVVFSIVTAGALLSHGTFPWWAGVASATFMVFLVGVAVWIVDPSFFED